MDFRAGLSTSALGNQKHVQSRQPRPPPNGRKMFRGRSYTGCITCRLRRIKCDEGKPSCRNCTKSRRACQGYLLPGEKTLPNIPASRPGRALSPGSPRVRYASPYLTDALGFAITRASYSAAGGEASGSAAGARPHTPEGRRIPSWEPCSERARQPPVDSPMESSPEAFASAHDAWAAGFPGAHRSDLQSPLFLHSPEAQHASSAIGGDRAMQSAEGFANHLLTGSRYPSGSFYEDLSTGPAYPARQGVGFDNYGPSHDQFAYGVGYPGDLAEQQSAPFNLGDLRSEDLGPPPVSYPLLDTEKFEALSQQLEALSSDDADTTPKTRRRRRQRRADIEEAMKDIVIGTITEDNPSGRALPRPTNAGLGSSGYTGYLPPHQSLPSLDVYGSHAPRPGPTPYPVPSMDHGFPSQQPRSNVPSFNSLLPNTLPSIETMLHENALAREQAQSYNYPTAPAMPAFRMLPPLIAPRANNPWQTQQASNLSIGNQSPWTTEAGTQQQENQLPRLGSPFVEEEPLDPSLFRVTSEEYKEWTAQDYHPMDQ